jgi:hypothetical protein
MDYMARLTTGECLLFDTPLASSPHHPSNASPNARWVKRPGEIFGDSTLVAYLLILPSSLSHAPVLHGHRGPLWAKGGDGRR